MPPHKRKGIKILSKTSSFIPQPATHPKNDDDEIEKARKVFAKKISDRTYTNTFIYVYHVADECRGFFRDFN